MKKRVLSALVIAVLTVALMSGFAVAKDLEFSILVCNMSHSFFVDLIKGAEDAGAELGVKIVTFDAQDDPAQQFRQVEDAIILGVDALILNPTDVDAMVPAVRQALNEGIPVFTVDRTSGRLARSLSSAPTTLKQRLMALKNARAAGSSRQTQTLESGHPRWNPRFLRCH